MKDKLSIRKIQWIKETKYYYRTTASWFMLFPYNFKWSGRGDKSRQEQWWKESRSKDRINKGVSTFCRTELRHLAFQFSHNQTWNKHQELSTNLQQLYLQGLNGMASPKARSSAKCPHNKFFYPIWLHKLKWEMDMYMFYNLVSTRQCLKIKVMTPLHAPATTLHSWFMFYTYPWSLDPFTTCQLRFTIYFPSSFYHV